MQNEQMIAEQQTTTNGQLSRRKMSADDVMARSFVRSNTRRILGTDVSRTKVESSKRKCNGSFSSLSVATHMPPLVHIVIVLLSLPFSHAVFVRADSALSSSVEKWKGANSEWENERKEKRKKKQ